MLDSALRQICSHALSDFGAAVDRVWMSWNPTETKNHCNAQRFKYQLRKKNICRKRTTRDEQLVTEINILEKQHQLQLAKAEYEAKSQAASELAELRVKLKNEKWALVTKKMKPSLQILEEELNYRLNKMYSRLNYKHIGDVKDELKQKYNEKFGQNHGFRRQKGGT